MRTKKKEAKREEEKGRKKRAKPGHFKRRCEGFASVEASEIFRQGWTSGELWWLVVGRSLGDA